MPVRGSGPRYSDVPVDVLAALVRDPDSFQPQITAWQEAKAEAEEAANTARDERNAATQAKAISDQAAADVIASRQRLAADIAAHEAARLAAIDAITAKQSELASRSQDLNDFQDTLLVRETEVKTREDAVTVAEAAITAKAAQLDATAASLEAEKARLEAWEATVRANLDDVKGRLAGFQWS